MVINLSISHFARDQYVNHTIYRKAVQSHLKTVLIGKSVFNDHLGIEIYFSNAGIDKMVSSIGEVKTFALCNLQLILKHAIHQETTKDRQNRPDILNVLRLITPVEIQGTNHEVWIYLRQRKEGFFLYSLNIDAQKTP